jgi:hypothetical protein
MIERSLGSVIAFNDDAHPVSIEISTNQLKPFASTQQFKTSAIGN